jgi:hypothetical protein
LLPHPWQKREGNGPDRVPLFALILFGGTAITVAVIVAALGLVELLTAKPALVVEAAVIAGAYVVELIVFHDNRRRLLLGVRVAAVVVASWITLSLGDATAFACGVAVGLLIAQGVRMVKSLPTDHVPTTADKGWRMDPWVAGGAVAAFLVAVLLGADLSSPQLEAVVGIVVGTVAAKAWRRRPPVLAGPMSRLLHDSLLRWTGYLPWHRRAFLQYAADRHVLARTGYAQYSFIHLLVRDHLAECVPDELAAKVDRRIAERAGR